MFIDEDKWRRYWEENKVFEASEKGDKFYVLEMFPYPSGDLHVGHLRNYVIGDVYARYYKMKGYSVLHPMGWDAFGLPAENAAIKKKISPKEWTLGNISVSKSTFKKMGIGYDWEREVTTCLPDYYKWTQYLFLIMYERGLAYKKESPVNWCPSCNTVLANEQVLNGKCYRCDTVVTKKDLEQWYFKITEYADRLLSDLDELPAWPEKVKTMQRNWIGRSEGITVDFALDGGNGKKIEVFTTRPDTLFGVTFLAVSPESPLVDMLDLDEKHLKEVKEYQEKAKLKSEIERVGTASEKDGVFTGKYVINPAGGKKAAVFVADYVISTYATGAVMGVPAHDERDFAFAEKYGLPVKIVIEPEGGFKEELENAYTEAGIMKDSGEFSGSPSEEAKGKIMDWLEGKNTGRRTLNYKLRDWLISRQRYWGAPIPVVYCPKCGIVPEKKENLPVLLPDPSSVDYVPKGRSPLGTAEDFVRTKCPVCGTEAKRDTDTMDTFVDSCWYFLRYCDPKNGKDIFEKGKADYWMPVDLYIGGIEHAILHLMFSRFIVKVLYDAGRISHKEPFKQLFTQGMVLNRVGGELHVMSKSKGNAVPVGPFVEEKGADAARATILFLAPPDRELEWSDASADAMIRFLKRILALGEFARTGAGADKDTEYEIDNTVKRITESTERFHLNTAISAMMEFVNFVYKKKEGDPNFILDAAVYEKFILAIAPFFPHLAEEVWQGTGHSGSVFTRAYPSFDEKKLVRDTCELPVQILGKLRGVIAVKRDAAESEVMAALSSSGFDKYMQGKTVKKVIYVPGKIVNIII